MSYSKLTIINRNLLLKGQSTVNVEDDGSNEWNVCSAAYDQAVAHLLEEHDWKFSTEFHDLTRLADSEDVNYEAKYAKPTGALHLSWVRGDDIAIDWKIVGNRIYVNDNDGAAVISAKVVMQPDPENWPAMFVSALDEWVKAAIESGLKKDAREGRAHMAQAEAFLAKARTRTDQEEPKRALFRPTLRNKRRQRRG